LFKDLIVGLFIASKLDFALRTHFLLHWKPTNAHTTLKVQ